MPKCSDILPVYHNILKSLEKRILGKIYENLKPSIFINLSQKYSLNYLYSYKIIDPFSYFLAMHNRNGICLRSHQAKCLTLNFISLNFTHLKITGYKALFFDLFACFSRHRFADLYASRSQQSVTEFISARIFRRDASVLICRNLFHINCFM